MATSKLPRTENEWRGKLSTEQHRVLREKETERPFSGKYVDMDEAGMYECAACGNPLFTSETKFGFEAFCRKYSQRMLIKKIYTLRHGRGF